MMTDLSPEPTEVGNYFIANYPPFSFWKQEYLPVLEQMFEQQPQGETPLGLYLHIPFCRKRCKFCYFRVYTDANAGAIQDYVDALAQEVELLAAKPAVLGRRIQFVYFGGGTPSYPSARQLEELGAKLRRSITWDQADEVTFECEPGTVNQAKLETLKAIGVTRLSLGVESFNDTILHENGRAHLSAEIDRAWEWIRACDFPQVNLDLIAGMVGETWDTWRHNLRRAIELDPDSVTVYPLELPYNTRYSKELLVLGQPLPIASWSLKRDWLRYAFEELAAAGYQVSSAYTMVKHRSGRPSMFRYRDSLWHGADLLGTGVASFGHLQGIHYQNVDALEDYLRLLGMHRLPLGRALPISARERLIREFILQMKLGKLDAGYFRQKFGVEVADEFHAPLRDLAQRGWMTMHGDELTLNREGMLRVDSLLPAFFLPEHRGQRYT